MVLATVALMVGPEDFMGFLMYTFLLLLMTAYFDELYRIRKEKGTKTLRETKKRRKRGPQILGWVQCPLMF